MVSASKKERLAVGRVFCVYRLNPMNLRAATYPRDSVILLWDRVPYTSHYTVAWHSHDLEQQADGGHVHGAASGQKTVLPALTTQQGCQIQPLQKGARYHITVTAYPTDPTKPLTTASLADVTPAGAYEENCEAAVHSGGGYFYYAGHDRPLLPVDRSMWHADMRIRKEGNTWESLHYKLNAADPGIWLWGRNGDFSNHERHWHIVHGDLGSGVQTLVPTLPILSKLLRKQPVTVLFDADIGPAGRAAWYLFLDPERHESLPVFPGGGGDTAPVSPSGYEMRWRSGVETATGWGMFTVFVFEGGVKTHEVTFSRGFSQANLRQIMGIRVHADKLEILCDRNYDGVPEAIGTLPVDFSKWPEGEWWPALTYASYNNIKINQQRGKNAYGQEPIAQAFTGGLWHLGNFFHDGHTEAQTLPDCHCSLEDPDYLAFLDTIPALGKMPPHSEFAKWFLPALDLVVPGYKLAAPPDTKQRFIVSADARLSVRLTGQAVPLRDMRLWAGERLLWSKTFDTPVFYTRPVEARDSLGRLIEGIDVDLTGLPDGDYPLKLTASTVHGAEASMVYPASLYTWAKPVPLRVVHEITNPDDDDVLDVGDTTGPGERP